MTIFINESFEAVDAYGCDMASPFWSKQGAVDANCTDHLFSGLGSQCLKVTKAGAANSSINHNFSPAVEAVYQQFSFYIASEGFVGGEQLLLFTDYTSAWATRAIFYVQKSGGNLYLRAGFKYNDDIMYGADQPISVGVEYRIRWKYDRANLSIVYYLNESKLVDVNPTTMASEGCGYYYIGDTGNTVTATVLFDGLWAADTGWPEPEGAIEVKVGIQ